MIARSRTGHRACCGAELLTSPMADAIVEE